MLTDEQLARYHRDGYVIPDYRVPPTTLRAIGDAHRRLVDKHPEFSDYCPAVLAFDTTFLRFAREPALLDMVEQILGPDFALWNSSFFAKPARTGSRTPWHQDGRYWPIRPITTCSAWIAVDDATRENGCLRVIPGSHRAGKLETHRHNPAAGLSLPLELEQDVDEPSVVDLVLEAGQISLHDVFLVHGSEPNASDNARRGLTLRFMPTTSVYRRDLADGRRGGPLAMSERTLYPMRGVDRSGGRNDYTVRH